MENVGITRIGALRIADRPAWLKEVKAAIRKHHGKIPAAAKELECSPRTLFRWVSEDAELADVPRHPQGQKYSAAK